MSDCPDCENKVVEAEEVKTEEVVAEAEEVKAEEAKTEEAAAEETAAEETAKKEDTIAVKILKSIGRVAAATIIVAGLIFIIWRHEILKAWYEQRESSTVVDMIKTQITAGLPGKAGEDFTYEIKYFDDGAPNPNYYEVIINCKGFEKPESYKVFASYDTVKKQLSLEFEGNGETDFRNIQFRLRSALRKPVVVETPAAEAPAAEAPVAEQK